MYRSLAIATCLSAAALIIAPAHSAVLLVSGIGTVETLSPLNTYKSQLTTLGLTGLTNQYASVDVIGAATQIRIYRLASESAYRNTLVAFGSAPIAEPAPQPVSGWTPNDLIVSVPVFTGSLANAVKFFSNGSGPAFTFNSHALGIFLPTNFSGTQYLTQDLYVGFDDVTNNPDKDFDDYIIRISVIPEPAAWLTMIAGFGLVGLSLRRNPMVTRALA